MTELSETPIQNIVVAPTQSILAFPNFRLLWLGQAISAFGSRFTEIAIPIFVLNQTGQALQLGIVFILQTVAALLFGFVAGTLTDRWNRQKVMVVADIVRTLIIFGILALTIFSFESDVQLTLLYIFAFLSSAVTQFFTPAKVAMIPDTVDKSRLVSANSLDQSTMTLMNFLGFGIAGGLIQLTGESIAFLVDASTFIVSAVFIALMRLPSAKKAKHQELPSLLEDMKAGLNLVWQVPILRAVVILSILAPLAIGAIQPLLLIFSREVLQAGDIGFGLLEGAFAIGIAFGAFILGKKGSGVWRGQLLAIGIIGMGGGFILSVLAPTLLSRSENATSLWLMVVSFPFIFLAAAFNAVLFIGIRTIIQEKSPRDMIGRVFGVISVVSSMAIAGGAGFAGFADTLPVGTILLFWGGFLVVVGVAAIAVRTFRESG